MHRSACAATQSDQHLCNSVYMESKIVKLVSFKISKFWLVSVAEQASFGLFLIQHLNQYVVERLLGFKEDLLWSWRCQNAEKATHVKGGGGYWIKQ